MNSKIRNENIARCVSELVEGLLLHHLDRIEEAAEINEKELCKVSFSCAWGAVDERPLVEVKIAYSKRYTDEASSYVASSYLTPYMQLGSPTKGGGSIDVSWREPVEGSRKHDKL